MPPLNTTSHLQPQDSGVILSFKARINAIKSQHVVDMLGLFTQHAQTVGKENLESVSEALFDVDVLVAIRWTQKTWDSVASATVSNCWKYTAILDEDI